MNSKSLYYFLKLRQAFKMIKNYVELPISMNKLVELFFCTQRNVKIIVNKLVEDGLIQFTPGRGRGHLSTIIFLKGFNEVLKEQTETLIKENEFNKALELVKEFGLGTEVEDYVIGWLNEYFGYNQIRHDNRDMDVLRFPIYRPITTVDPTRVFFDLDAHIVMQVFNTLVEYNFITKTFSSCLAHAWESDEEMKNWLFFLRKGVKFHNGKELTAVDVKNSILRLQKSPHSWLVEDIQDISVQSKYSILFRLKNPNYLFLHFVSFTPMSIVDTSHQYEGFAEFPIGTGAFQFQKIESDYCELITFDSYFNFRPQLDKIEIIRMNDSLQDSITQWQKISLNTGESEFNSDWQETKTVFSGTNLITINTNKNGPLQNEEFRRLIGSLIDREKLAHLGEPRLGPAEGFILDEGQSYESGIEVQVVPKLESLGYNGELLSLFTYQRHERDALAIQKMLLEHGIHLKINVVEWNIIQDGDVLSNADMILFEGTPNEGIISILDLILFRQGFIYPFLSPNLKQKVESLIRQMKLAATVHSRNVLHEQLGKFLKEIGVILFLVHKRVDVHYDDVLEGVAFSSRMWVDFRKLWYKNDHL